MSRTISIRRLFVTTTLQAQGAPLVDRGVTHCTRQAPARWARDGSPYEGERPPGQLGLTRRGPVVLPAPEHLVGDALVVRLPFVTGRPCRALVVGLWRKPPPAPRFPPPPSGAWGGRYYDGRKATLAPGPEADSVRVRDAS